MDKFAQGSIIAPSSDWLQPAIKPQNCACRGKKLEYSYVFVRIRFILWGLHFSRGKMRLFAQRVAKGMKSIRQDQKPMDQLNIFDNRSGDETGGQAPLAERMRPRNLGEFIGQPHLLGPGKILDRVLRNRRFHSLILR